MGTCQSSEAATVVIHHPGNKVERIYWSVRAQDIMNSNPGHYVAFVVTPPSTTTSSSFSRAENNGGVAPNNSRQLKLLRPNDTLLMGQVYRLISFEDVIKELAAKKSVKLGKLLKESGVLNPSLEPTSEPHNSSSFQQVDQEVHGLGNNNGSGASSSNKSSYRGVGRQHGGGKGGQWKPALQSISEIGT